jgi:hypothetical protein
MAAERIPQGGAVVPYSLLGAAQGAARDPRAAYSYYSGGGRGKNFLSQFLGQLGGAAAFVPGAAVVAPAAMYGFGEAAEGRPAGALTGAAAALGAGGLTSALTAGLRGSPNPLAKLAGFALPALAGAVAAPVAGGAAEMAVSAYTGKPPTGKTGPEVAQPPRFVDTPLGRINLNDAAAMEDYTNRNIKRQIDYQTTIMGMETSRLKDLTQHSMEMEVQGQKAMLPITTKLANDQLTRAQALINTQNNAYLQQMTLGAQSNLALGAQRERGATMRQALATNPYVVALSAPNISIG